MTEPKSSGDLDPLPSVEAPESVTHWSQLIRDWEAGADDARLIPVGSCSKPGLSKPFLDAPSTSAPKRFSARCLSGIIQYDPSEFTISVASGTPVRDVMQALAQHGQTLPFDPPRANANATIGGCVASGWSGPGRWRYGGLRDFILAASFLDGLGNEVHTGAPVVKNAAGFDFPKLMVGSLGRLGVLTRLTFKVFPQSESPQTWAIHFESLGEAAEYMQSLTRMPIEIDAIELCSPGTFSALTSQTGEDIGAKGWAIVLRIPGPQSVVRATVERIQSTVDGPAPQQLPEEAAASVWDLLLNHQAAVSVRVPITPRQMNVLQEDFPKSLNDNSWHVHFGLAGNVMFIRGSGTVQELHDWLCRHGLAGTLLNVDETCEGSERTGCGIGIWRHDEVVLRVARGIDPHQRFAPFVFGKPMHQHTSTHRHLMPKVKG
ncbi:FAD-binding protein [Rhodopirellula halodulae]|uniref:FAD-binding protein n=1 Tax=Rhodopirellula halodulae TaxID=2894198 RepID=UPI001E3955C9|nr:FAD-binding protein [Rhodopirellula sp. JC737]MCC9655969.1 FAD-binding protein [Rhodopirellula sp. JC737]